MAPTIEQLKNDLELQENRRYKHLPTGNIGSLMSYSLTSAWNSDVMNCEMTLVYGVNGETDTIEDSINNFEEFPTA